jgi:hypothetical protein
MGSCSTEAVNSSSLRRKSSFTFRRSALSANPRRITGANRVRRSFIINTAPPITVTRAAATTAPIRAQRHSLAICHKQIEPPPNNSPIAVFAFIEP